MSALEAACSRHVGIVTHVDELLAAPDDSRLTHIVAVGARGSDELEPGGAGYAATAAAARAAALGEAIERYAAAERPPHLVLAAAGELPNAIEPERFALFAPWQLATPGFPFAPFTSRTRVRWVAGRSLSDGRVVRVPAQLVYLRWSGLEDGEGRIGYATSSGLACGECFESAALAALLELVERDAFLVVWRARLSLPHLVVGDDSELVAWEGRYLAHSRLRHVVLDLSPVNGVPTALAVVRDAAGSLAVGAAAAAEARSAYRKALAEAYAGHGAARRMRRDAARVGADPDVSDITTFADHIRVYANPANAARAGFLTAARESVSTGAIRPLRGTRPHELLESLVELLVDAGIEPYAVDVTPSDVASLGLHVVRVVAPELCPLDVRQDACFLGAPRLRRAPVVRNLHGRELELEELNLDPHPFP